MQLRAVGSRQRAAPQCSAVADQQTACIEIHTTGKRIGSTQGQCRGAALGQATCATDAAIEGEILATTELQVRIQYDSIGENACRGAVEQAATHAQGPGTQCGVAAQDHATCGQTRATGIRVVAGQGQTGGAEFVQAAGAGDIAGERERIAAAHVDQPRQCDRIGERADRRVVQRGARCCGQCTDA